MRKTKSPNQFSLFLTGLDAIIQEVCDTFHVSPQEVKRLDRKRKKIKDRRLRELKASGKIRYRQPAGGRVTEYWRDDIERYKAGELVISSKE